MCSVILDRHVQNKVLGITYRAQSELTTTTVILYRGTWNDSVVNVISSVRIFGLFGLSDIHQMYMG